ncbi:MAG TPA: FtsX-like permease family protein [Oceanospirillales bacterium]|nr:FtsX-like permease family protein [Oceanospirillales bacterium]
MIKTARKPSAFLTYVRGHKRAFREGFFMPWKRPIKSFMTILTLAICFYIPLFLWTLWLNYDELKQNWQNQGTIALFLDNNLDLKEAGIFLQEIKDLDFVEAANLLNSNEIKKQLASDEQLSQIISLITAQDLPKQISVKIKTDTTLDTIEQFVAKQNINPQVEYVSYDKQWLEQLQVLTNTLLQMARISALMFILIVMVILGNTIANEITDHKNELRLLELIGASWAQVRRSFLYMGTFFGLYAGILSLLMLSVSFMWLQDSISALIQSFGVAIELHGLSLMQMLSVLGLTIVVTWLAARLTLSSRLLNQIQD